MDKRWTGRETLALAWGLGLSWLWWKVYWETPLSAMNLHAVVAAYNVDAYLDGRLETLDVGYLGSLGHGSAPALNRLATAYGEPGVDWRTYDYYMDEPLGHYDRPWAARDLQSVRYYLE